MVWIEIPHLFPNNVSNKVVQNLVTSESRSIPNNFQPKITLRARNEVGEQVQRVDVGSHSTKKNIVGASSLESSGPFINQIIPLYYFYNTHFELKTLVD